MSVEVTVSQLYAEHGRRLYRYAYALTGDASAAEDAVQQAFCDVVSLLSRGHEVNLSAGYLVRCVRNECFSLIRRRKLHAEAVADLAVLSAEERGASDGVFVAQVLARLPVAQRDVLVLKMFEGFTFKEIAGISNVSHDTAASRYRYAIAALRRLLSASSDDEHHE